HTVANRCGLERKISDHHVQVSILIEVSEADPCGASLCRNRGEIRKLSVTGIEQDADRILRKIGSEKVGFAVVIHILDRDAHRTAASRWRGGIHCRSLERAVAFAEHHKTLWRCANPQIGE